MEIAGAKASAFLFVSEKLLTLWVFVTGPRGKVQKRAFLRP